MCFVQKLQIILFNESSRICGFVSWNFIKKWWIFQNSKLFKINITLISTNTKRLSLPFPKTLWLCSLEFFSKNDNFSKFKIFQNSNHSNFYIPPHVSPSSFLKDCGFVPWNFVKKWLIFQGGRINWPQVKL